MADAGRGNVLRVPDRARRSCPRHRCSRAPARRHAGRSRQRVGSRLQSRFAGHSAAKPDRALERQTLDDHAQPKPVTATTLVGSNAQGASSKRLSACPVEHRPHLAADPSHTRTSGIAAQQLGQRDRQQDASSRKVIMHHHVVREEPCRRFEPPLERCRWRRWRPVEEEKAPFRRDPWQAATRASRALPRVRRKMASHRISHQALGQVTRRGVRRADDNALPQLGQSAAGRAGAAGVR